MRCLSLAIAILAMSSFVAYSQVDRGDDNETIYSEDRRSLHLHWRRRSGWLVKKSSLLSQAKFMSSSFWATWCGALRGDDAAFWATCSRSWGRKE